MQCRTALSLVAFFLLTAAAQAQDRVLVLVAYFSEQGHTKAMAEAVAQGARSVAGTEVELLTVATARTEDLLKADAVILGSPVYNANAAPQVLKFIKSWPLVNGRMKDKIGAAFVTGGGISAGEELVQMNLLHAMLIFGMMVVGGPDWTTAFGASAVTEEAPFQNGDPVDAHFLNKGEALGKRVARLAVRLQCAREH